MNIIDKYNDSLQKLYDYFGFVEDWVVFPIDDRREFYWHIVDGQVLFYDTLEAYQNDDENHMYSDEVMNHCFYKKSVYEGKDMTMIIVDTHTDGNKFLAIYNNTLKIL